MLMRSVLVVELAGSFSGDASWLLDSVMWGMFVGGASGAV